MDGISLPPDLEEFAAEVVASDAFRDTAEVVAAGVRLLRRQQAERAEFVRSLEDAEAESDRDGWISLDEVMVESDAIIAEFRRAD